MFFRPSQQDQGYFYNPGKLTPPIDNNTKGKGQDLTKQSFLCELTQVNKVPSRPFSSFFILMYANENVEQVENYLRNNLPNLKRISHVKPRLPVVPEVKFKTFTLRSLAEQSLN